MIRFFRGEREAWEIPARAVAVVPGEDTLRSPAKSEGNLTAPLVQPLPKIPINRANVEALVSLPGIGPVLARRIIEDRQTHGPYRKPEDLLRVKGIGQKKLDRIRDHITCEGDGTEKAERRKERTSYEGDIVSPESF